MTLAEYLGYARSLLDSLGVTPFLIAGLVIMLAVSMLRYFRGD